MPSERAHAAPENFHSALIDCVCYYFNIIFEYYEGGFDDKFKFFRRSINHFYNRCIRFTHYYYYYYYAERGGQ